MFKKIEHLLEKIQDNIFQKAFSFRDNSTFYVDTWDEFKTQIEKGGFIVYKKVGQQLDQTIDMSEFYNDAKYVRMACNTAYSGLLIALNDLFKYKGVPFPNKTKNTGDR